MRTLLASMVLALTLTNPALAGEIEVSLTNAAGLPVADAVVMVSPASGVPKAQIRFPWAYVMAQKNMMFAPFVLVVPVGAEVAFPNLDPILHHVYSFSAAKPFELKLYGRDETRKVRFDKPGVVSVGCNIHDDMSGFIRVVETPFAAKTNAQGAVTIAGLPSGAATVTLWHPYQKTARGEIVRSIEIPQSGAVRLVQTMDLRRAPMKQGGY